MEPEMDMDRLHEDVNRLLREQAVQSQMLTTIASRLDQSATLMAQQAAQIGSLTTTVATLTTSLEVLKNDQITWRQEMTSRLNQIATWQTDAMTFFIPRKEHEAQDLPGRVRILEEAMKKLDEKRFDFLQWLVANAVPILLFIVTAILTIYNNLPHH